MLEESQSLSCEQVGCIQNSIRDFAINRAEIAGDIIGPISTSKTMHVGNDLEVIQSLEVPTTPINKLFEEKEVINNAESLIDILNACAPFD